MVMTNMGKSNGIDVVAVDSRDVFSAKEGWQMEASREIAELATALSKAQGVVEGAKKAKDNPAFKGVKYANLEAVWDAIREPFTKEGLSIVQFPCEAPAGHIGLRTILLHKSGQYLEERFYMPMKDASNPQAAGSAITYARRYSLMAVAGIAPEDDDGNQAAKVDVAGLKASFYAAFKAATSVDEMKAVAIDCKNSPLPPSDKTELLLAFSIEIKQAANKQVGV